MSIPNRSNWRTSAGSPKGRGGSPYNVLIDLARLGAPFPLSGAGLVGQDDFGARIREDCRQHRIDTKYLLRTSRAPTSYTDVMTEKKGGRRTFFHNRGANALWAGGDLDFDQTKARIFHLGYLLLLDALDTPDRKGGTRAGALLAKAQAAGIKTSVDVVSEEGSRYPEVVRPALKHVDYCILNEIEAGNTTGFKLRPGDGRIDTTAVRHAAGALLQCGVKEVVVIHFPEGAFARTREGKDYWQSSLDLPQKFVAGTAGAGDAFCAGVLYGLHEGWEIERSLITGACAAAASLADPTCTGGMKPLPKVMALGRKFGYRPALSSDD